MSFRRQQKRTSLVPRRMTVENQPRHLDVFQKHDIDKNGILDRGEVGSAISEILGYKLTATHVDDLFEEFDKDGNGEIDFSEFSVMVNYFKIAMKIPVVRKSTVNQDMLDDLGNDDLDDDASDDDDVQYEFDPVTRGLKKVYGHTQHQSIIDSKNEENDGRMAALLDSTISRSKTNRNSILRNIAKELYPVRDILCLQNANFNFEDTDDDDDEFFLNEEKAQSKINHLDTDFEAAFPPSDMRCLALVSHNGMKKTMRVFVMANKNLLKKFRLTGTNSTMTMLKEVFKDEPPGSIIYGPACASGPLGGDAELVALMVAGRIGGILFFQDPMNSHPHRADIDCLVRQALVHNTMLAENPTSAYMLVQCLRSALVDNTAELIPSFFFSLESPTVLEYKNQQSSVVNSHIECNDVIEKPSPSSRKAKVITFIREVESEGDDLACSLSESMLKDCTNGNDVFGLVTDEENAEEVDHEGVFAFDEAVYASISTTKTHEMVFCFNKQKFQQTTFFHLPISDILNGEDHSVIIYVTVKEKKNTTVYRRLQFNKS